MKSTKIMLCVFFVFIVTWLTMGAFAYVLNGEITFREAITCAPVIMLMLIVGWIPSVIVAHDLDEQL